ncbi:MAG: chromate efflux transporter [Bacillota bacterium]
MKADQELNYKNHTEKYVKLTDIAFTLLCIGLSSFSVAVLFELKKKIVEEKHWLNNDEYLNGLGLAQMLPGALAVNFVAYVGHTLRGLQGSIIAVIFFMLPCFTLMVLLSYLYLKLGELPVIISLQNGLSAMVVGLVLNFIIDLWKSGANNPKLTLLAILGFIVVYFYKSSVFPIFAVAGAISVFFVILEKIFPRWGKFISQGFWQEKKDQEIKLKIIKATFNMKNYLFMVSCLFLIIGIDFFLIYMQARLAQVGTLFFKIGALIFGGGYAMLPFIQDTVVNQYHWLDNREFGIALALSLITPGPVAIISAFIGFKVAGLAGAFIAAVNMYLPSFALTNIIAPLYREVSQITVIKQILKGIVAAFIGTMLSLIIKLTSTNLVDLQTWGIAIAAFVAQRYMKVGTVWIILAGAVISLILF